MSSFVLMRLPALTPLSLSILALSVLAMCFSPLLPVLEDVAVITLLGLIVLIILDLVLTPGPRSLQVIRNLSPRLSLGDQNPVGLVIRNHGRIPARGRIGDNLPTEFQRRDVLFSFSVQAAGQQSFAYAVRPLRRGRFQFSEISVESRGLLRLVAKRWHTPVESVAKCYPSYLQLKNVQLNARRYNLGQMGQKQQRQYGQGREFESLRNYTRDDDYRKINWKATARRGKPIVAQYRIERNQNIIFVLDAGRMMRAWGGDMSKLDYAVNATLMLSYLCIHKEDNVGLLVFGARTQAWIPPARGVSQLGRINEALYALEAELTEPNYQMAFQFLRRKISRRSLVVLVTDLMDDLSSAPIIHEFVRLYPQHLPLCVTLRDLNLEKLAGISPTSRYEMAEMAVAQMLVEDRLKALRKLQLGGVLTLDTDPGNLTADAINKYLDIKAKSLI